MTLYYQKSFEYTKTRGAREFLHRVFLFFSVFQQVCQGDALEEIVNPVSYTHLDVYKRQAKGITDCEPVTSVTGSQ